MAALIQDALELRNASLTTRRDGANGGTLEIYSGARPANPDTAPGGGNTLLASITLDAVAGSVAGGVLTMDTTPILRDASANASGTASWFRVKKSNGNPWWDGNCGLADADMIFVGTLDLISGLPFEVSSWTVTDGNS